MSGSKVSNKKESKLSSKIFKWAVKQLFFNITKVTI